MENILSTEYLSGFFDADGGMIKNGIAVTNTDFNLIERISDSLVYYGIYHKIKSVKTYQRNHNEAARIHIFGFVNLLFFASKIGFKIERKQNALIQYLKPMCEHKKLYCLLEHDISIKRKNQDFSIRSTGRLLNISYGTLNDRFKKGLWPLDEEIIKNIRVLHLDEI